MEMKHTIDSVIHFFFIISGSCQMDGIISLYNYISGYLTGTLCFVGMLLLLVILYHLDGYRHIKQVIVETKTDFINWIRFVWAWTHSTTLELIWTIIPTSILVAIGVPSFILLYSLDEIVDCQATVKIIAYQWYWKYEYPVNFSDECDVMNVEVVSYMLPNTDLTDYLPLRLLEVDMPLVLPHSVNVNLIVTSKDVLHSFAVPALGIKIDAVPGRLNQVTVFITKPGVYYGQCSELCGVNHAFMPIVIHAISYESYENFLFKIALAEKADLVQRAYDRLYETEAGKALLEDGDDEEIKIPKKSRELSNGDIYEKYIGYRMKNEPEIYSSMSEEEYWNRAMSKKFFEDLKAWGEIPNYNYNKEDQRYLDIKHCLQREWKRLDALAALLPCTENDPEPCCKFEMQYRKYLGEQKFK